MRTIMLLVCSFALVAAGEGGPTEPLSLKPISVRSATTKEGVLFSGMKVVDWVVVEVEVSSRAHFLPSSTQTQRLFVDDVACVEAWQGTKLWCVVPRVSGAKPQLLWGPVAIGAGSTMSADQLLRLRASGEKEGKSGADSVARAERVQLTAEKLQSLREASAKTGRSWALSTIVQKDRLVAESRSELLRALETGASPP